MDYVSQIEYQAWEKTGDVAIPLWLLEDTKGSWKGVLVTVNTDICLPTLSLNLLKAAIKDRSYFGGCVLQLNNG